MKLSDDRDVVKCCAVALGAASANVSFVDWLQPHQFVALKEESPSPQVHNAQTEGVVREGVEEDSLHSDAATEPHSRPLTGCQFSFSQSIAAKECLLYGMDAASAAAVIALDIAPSHHVLDLCCAPGAKLAMICDLAASGTGVDISQPRLNTCRNLLRKYGVTNVRLFLGDGATFAEPPPGPPAPHSQRPIVETEGQPRKLGKYARKRVKQTAQRQAIEKGGHVIWLTGTDLADCALADHLYDRVLVDVECTHDGSGRHLSRIVDAEAAQWKSSALDKQLLSEENVNKIVCVQKQMIVNGFRLVRLGGLLVYSTCSLTTAQNENVVEWFLTTHTAADAKAVVVSSPALDAMCCVHSDISDGQGQAYRFNPQTSRTSGLFVCVIQKVPSQ